MKESKTLIAAIETAKASDDPRQARLAILKYLTDEVLVPSERYDLIASLTQILYDAGSAGRAPADKPETKVAAIPEKFRLRDFVRYAKAGTGAVYKWCKRTNRDPKGDFTQADIDEYRAHVRLIKIQTAERMRKHIGSRGYKEPASAPQPQPQPNEHKLRQGTYSDADAHYNMSEESAANFLGVGYEKKVLALKRMRGEMPPHKKRGGEVFYRTIDIQSMKSRVEVVPATNVTPISDARINRAEEKLRQLREG